MSLAGPKPASIVTNYAALTAPFSTFTALSESSLFQINATNLRSGGWFHVIAFAEKLLQA
jgi:hypothetical protein